MEIDQIKQINSGVTTNFENQIRKLKEEAEVLNEKIYDYEATK